MTKSWHVLHSKPHAAISNISFIKLITKIVIEWNIIDVRKVFPIDKPSLYLYCAWKYSYRVVMNDKIWCIYIYIYIYIYNWYIKFYTWGWIIHVIPQVQASDTIFHCQIRTVNTCDLFCPGNKFDRDIKCFFNTIWYWWYFNRGCTMEIHIAWQQYVISSYCLNLIYDYSHLNLYFTQFINVV